MEDGTDEILEMYQWAPDDCFRCAARGLDTTVLAVLTAACGQRQPVRACRACVIDMEGMRRRAAERAGRPYEPGHLADVG